MTARNFSTGAFLNSLIAGKRIETLSPHSILSQNQVNNPSKSRSLREGSALFQDTSRLREGYA